jgi:hypothetical protein
MSSTLTHEEEQQIVEWLADHPTLTQGVGTEEAACSVAAWNLALTGTLTDKIPDCASEVIGRWIIGVQDSCPPEHCRRDTEWLRLLPLAAGTGRAHEAERLAIVLDWMLGTVLPSVQRVADKNEFGEQWRVICTVRTHAAGNAAYLAWYAGNAARYAADAANEVGPDAWATFAPIEVLRKLIAVTDARAKA